jgi:hypothetical protein
VKTAILLKGIYRLSAIPNKFPLSFFIVIEKNILKFIMETQETLNSQSNPEQKRAMLFKLHYRAIVAKPA